MNDLFGSFFCACFTGKEGENMKLFILIFCIAGGIWVLSVGIYATVLLADEIMWEEASEEEDDDGVYRKQTYLSE